MQSILGTANAVGGRAAPRFESDEDAQKKMRQQSLMMRTGPEIALESSHIDSAAQRALLEECWNKYDADQSNSLDLNELKSMCFDLFGKLPSVRLERDVMGLRLWTAALESIAYNTALFFFEIVEMQDSTIEPMKGINREQFETAFISLFTPTKRPREQTMRDMKVSETPFNPEQIGTPQKKQLHEKYTERMFRTIRTWEESRKKQLRNLFDIINRSYSIGVHVLDEEQHRVNTLRSALFRPAGQRSVIETEFVLDLLQSSIHERYNASEETLTALGRYTSGKVLRREEVLYERGHAVDYVYIIVVGSVYVYLDREDGSRNTLAVLGKNTIFGELALLGKRKRTSSIRAREPTTLARIHGEQFLEMMKSYFLKRVSERQTWFRENIMMQRFATEALVQRLSYISNTLQFSDGEEIVSQGQPCTSTLYFVVRGQVSFYQDITVSHEKLQQLVTPIQMATLLSSQSSRARAKQIYTFKVRRGCLGPRFTFAEHSLIDRSRRSVYRYTAVASSRTLLISVHSKEFVEKAPAVLIQALVNLISTEPSEDEVLRAAVESTQWTNYKQKLLNVIEMEHEQHRGHRPSAPMIMPQWNSTGPDSDAGANHVFRHKFYKSNFVNFETYAKQSLVDVKQFKQSKALEIVESLHNDLNSFDFSQDNPAEDHESENVTNLSVEEVIGTLGVDVFAEADSKEHHRFQDLVEQARHIRLQKQQELRQGYQNSCTKRMKKYRAITEPPKVKKKVRQPSKRQQCLHSIQKQNLSRSKSLRVLNKRQQALSRQTSSIFFSDAKLKSILFGNDDA